MAAAYHPAPSFPSFSCSLFREAMDKPPRRSSLGTRAIGAGLTLAVSVGLLAYGGLWLDEKLGTKPLFLLVGVVWGVVGGTIHLVRVISPELLPWGRKRKDGEGDEPPR